MTLTSTVVRPGRDEVGQGEDRRAAGRDLRRADQHRADPPGRRRPARRRPPGHALDQDARRGPRWRQEAVPPEGHRPRPPGLDPRAAVRRRWRRARPAAARLRPAHPEEDEGGRAARCPVRPGPQRPRPRGVLAGRRRRRRRPRRGRDLLAKISAAKHVLVVAERTDELTLEEPAQPRRGAPARAGSAQHLRRAGQRRRRVHRGRARRLPRRLAQGQVGQGDRAEHETGSEATVERAS